MCYPNATEDRPSVSSAVFPQAFGPPSLSPTPAHGVAVAGNEVYNHLDLLTRDIMAMSTAIGRPLGTYAASSVVPGPAPRNVPTRSARLAAPHCKRQVGSAKHRGRARSGTLPPPSWQIVWADQELSNIPEPEAVDEAGEVVQQEAQSQNQMPEQVSCAAPTEGAVFSL